MKKSIELQNFTLEVKENGIAYFIHNRPDKLNAMNDQSWYEVQTFFESIANEPSIKAVIVTGAGDKAFVAGADIGDSIAKWVPIDCFAGSGQKALNAIEDCPKPVIAAINGYALGGGFELALACDFRIASENALFGFPETGLGILPGAGGTQRIARLLGLGRAKEMVLLGKNVTSEEAAAMGLVYKTVPLNELYTEAEKMAAKVLSKGPVAITVSKMALKASLSSSQEIGMLIENLGFGILLSTEDKKEGVQAFLEKRKPNYSGK